MNDPAPGPQRATPVSDADKWFEEGTRQAKQLRDDERHAKAAVELPRSIVEVIYRGLCCKPTPELAKNEPCACVAAYVVDQIEEWAASLSAKAVEESEATR